ncbi:MAG: hypothetical protein FK730_00730 [Asgard group archaeon]|nr:hypothetical protein [Asgard group archaeon]
MTLVIDDKLLNQFRMIYLNQNEEVKFSILLGTIDTEIKEVTIISAIHYPKDNPKEKTKISLTENEVNEIIALNYMLPYNLDIIGLVFYYENEISDFTLQTLAKNTSKIPTLKFIINVKKIIIDYYQISPEKITKIKANTMEIPMQNLLKFIFTMEFETADTVLTEQNKLKKALFDGLDQYWDKVTFNLDQTTKLHDIQLAKSPIDRIIEIQIPCEEKNLSSATKKGNVFFAYDLHINFYVKKSHHSNKLSEITGQLNKALKRDLQVKLQRSFFDENIKRLITPEKIPINCCALELNGYLSKVVTSKYEFNICTRLIEHANIIAKLGNLVQARILLRDLLIYFKELDNESLQLKIQELIKQLSNL